MGTNLFIVIPNWNGAEDLSKCLDSVLVQSHKKLTVVVVDNGSTDESRKIIENYQQKDPRVRSIYNKENFGFTGGVNPGIQLAIREGATYVALLNNDATADKDWLKHLVQFLEEHPAYGIAACAMLLEDGKSIDSTADQYTIWGLGFPRGRGEPEAARRSFGTEIFGASGGASMYRTAMLRSIGLFDQDFFAYYEDIDISFRAQLAGWKVGYVPDSLVYHAVGKTTQKLNKRRSTDHVPSTFTTTQYMKNLPFVLVKNVPAGLLFRVWPRFMLAYTLVFAKAVATGRGGSAIKGVAEFWWKLPKKLGERRRIQKRRTVTNAYLWSMFTHDLPPNAAGLRKLRSFWHRLIGRQ